MSPARRLELLNDEMLNEQATAALPELKLYTEVTYGPFEMPPLSTPAQQLSSLRNGETSIQSSGQTSRQLRQELGNKTGPIISRPESAQNVSQMRVATTSLALGVNILGANQKICSFDCPYCSLGATTTRLNRLKRDIEFPTPAEIKVALTQELKRLHTEGPSIDSLCLSGNGEPTLHPDFPEVIQAVIDARDEFAPGKPIRILSNGSTLDTRKIVEAMNRLDERIIRVDVGNEKLFKTVNAPFSRITLSRILSGIRSLKDVTIQSLFIKGFVDNTMPTDLDDWIEAIALIKPRRVQISTITQKPASTASIRLDEDALYTIASRLERKTQIRALVIT